MEALAEALLDFRCPGDLSAWLPPQLIHTGTAGSVVRCLLAGSDLTRIEQVLAELGERAATSCSPQVICSLNAFSAPGCSGCP